MLREYGACKQLGEFNVLKPQTQAEKLDDVLRVCSRVLQQQEQQQQQHQALLQGSWAAGRRQSAAMAAAVKDSVLMQLHPSVQAALKPMLMPEAAAALEKLLDAGTAAAAAGLGSLAGTTPVVMVVTQQQEEAQIQAELQQAQQTGARQPQPHQQQQPQQPDMLAAVGAASHTQQQPQQQSDSLAAAAVAAAQLQQEETPAAAPLDAEDVVVTMMVDPEDSTDTGPQQAAAGPSAVGGLSPSTMMFTPSKGFRPLSAINSQPVFSPSGGHGSSFWPGNLPPQHRQLLLAEPWRQQGYAQGEAGSALMVSNRWQPMMPVPGFGGMGSAQQQQQEAENAELAQLRDENARLKLQLQQGAFSAAAAAAATTPSLLNPGFDPTQALLQPTIAGLPGLQQPAGCNPGILAAVKYAAHEAGLAAAHQALQQVAQHGGLLTVQPHQQQAGGGAAAAGFGGAAVSAAAAAASAAAAAPIIKPKGIKAWGKQQSFGAFWTWWTSVPPGFSDSRAALHARKDNTWRPFDKKQRVSELNQFLRVIADKQQALGEQLGGIPATQEQGVAALDLEMQEQGLKTLAAYHKKHMKSPFVDAVARGAAAAAAADGEDAAAGEGVEAAEGGAAAPETGEGAAAAASGEGAGDASDSDAGAAATSSRRGVKRGKGPAAHSSGSKKKR